VAGSRSSAVSSSGVCLLKREVLLEADALLRQPRLQLVAHDLDLVRDHHLGQLDARVADREVDDPVAEDV
jgi:hypothetical protein